MLDKTLPRGIDTSTRGLMLACKHGDSNMCACVKIRENKRHV
jgi:hypothetical protein